MPTILNHTEHAFNYPMRREERNGNGVQLLSRTIDFPRAKTETDSTGNDVHVPGRAVISDAELKAMQEDRVAQHWFRPGPRGEAQLVVETPKGAEKAEAKKSEGEKK